MDLLQVVLGVEIDVVVVVAAAAAAVSEAEEPGMGVDVVLWEGRAGCSDPDGDDGHVPFGGATKVPLPPGTDTTGFVGTEDGFVVAVVVALARGMETLLAGTVVLRGTGTYVDVDVDVDVDVVKTALDVWFASAVALGDAGNR